MKPAKFPIISALMLGLPMAGCDPSSNKSGRRSDNPVASMAKGFGGADACSDECVRVAQATLRSDAAVDPRDIASQEAEGWARFLESLPGENPAAQSIVRDVPLAAGLDAIERRTANRVVLRHESGHIFTVLGVSLVAGKPLFETVHGNGDVYLLTRDMLADGDIRSAWMVSKGTAGSIPIRIGKSVLQVDQLLYFVGATRYGDRPSCRIRLRNTGQVPIILDRPTASCSCTLIDVTERKELPPDATLEFGVSTEARGAPTLRSTVAILAYESGSGRSREVKFTILGYETMQRRFYPHEMDFEAITAGSIARRTVTFKETPTNRFRITGLECDDRAIQHTIETVTGDDGLATYLIHFALTPVGGTVGEARGTVRIKTSGITDNNDTIPFNYVLMPSLRAIPQTVALGPVPIGQSRRAAVRFEWSKGEDYDLQIESQPEGCSASIDQSKRPPEMILDVQIKDPGAWQGLIKVKARRANETHTVEVKCVGLGTSPGQ